LLAIACVAPQRAAQTYVKLTGYASIILSHCEDSSKYQLRRNSWGDSVGVRWMSL